MQKYCRSVTRALQYKSIERLLQEYYRGATGISEVLEEWSRSVTGSAEIRHEYDKSIT